jgi:hypothetical protein
MPFGRGIAGAGNSSINMASSGLNLNPQSIWNGLEYTIQKWVGGSYANIPLLMLAILGISKFSHNTKPFQRMITLWIILPSLALLFASPENYMFYRILYLLPIQIIAAIGLLELFQKAYFKKSKYGKILRFAIQILTIILFLNNVLRLATGASNLA